MVRAALQPRGRLNRGPRKGVTIIPAASVVLMSCLAMLPVVAYRGGWPDFGFLMLVACRGRRHPRDQQERGRETYGDGDGAFTANITGLGQ